MKQQLFLTFPQQVLNEPVIYMLGHDFRLVPNIRGAMITEQMGMMALELDGDPAEIERAIAFLTGEGRQSRVVATPHGLRGGWRLLLPVGGSAERLERSPAVHALHGRFVMF